MLTQVYYDGYSLTMTKAVIKYQRDKYVAVSKDDMYIITCRVYKILRKTTVGWYLLVKCYDGSESWINLDK